MVILTHALRMAEQLVDSALPSTREFWRRKMGHPDPVVTDPRPLAVIVAELNEKEAAHVDA